MANILENYNENLPAEEVTPGNENSSAAEWFRKRERKLLKAIRKMIKRQNKLLKEEFEQKKAEREAAEAERAVAKQAADSGRGQVVKGFFNKLGDAICKAIPRVLTTLVPLLFGWLIKARPTGRVPQTR